MNFVDFQIRAWKTDDAHVHVLVHNSPAGDMRQPITVDFPGQQIEQLRSIFTQQRWFMASDRQQQIIALGRLLWQVLLPRPVATLLQCSLDRIDAADGLRVRLCLDQHLIDLPWEYLYNADGNARRERDAFLFLDGRMSLVREPPVAQLPRRPSAQVQRMVFAGTYHAEGADIFDVGTEAEQLRQVLAPLRDRVQLDVISAAGDQIERALRTPAAIFHYAGHTDTAGGNSYLVREVGMPSRNSAGDPADAASSGSQLFYVPLDVEIVSDLLRRAGTRLAVFNACNSGHWPFAEPIIHSGVAAFVGLQGFVSNQACIVFCEKLYASLINGLSLDEAVTWARLSVLQDARFDGADSTEWGTFMVYLPTSEVILFPPPPSGDSESRRGAVERERARSIDKLDVGTAFTDAIAIDRRALREALVRAFSLEELEMLCADVEQDLRNDRIDVRIDLDVVGGDGLENKALKLIDYLDRRGYLPYLATGIRRARPGLI